MTQPAEERVQMNPLAREQGQSVEYRDPLGEVEYEDEFDLETRAISEQG